VDYQAQGCAPWSNTQRWHHPRTGTCALRFIGWGTSLLGTLLGALRASRIAHDAFADLSRRWGATVEELGYHGIDLPRRRPLKTASFYWKRPTVAVEGGPGGARRANGGLDWQRNLQCLWRSGVTLPLNVLGTRDADRKTRRHSWRHGPFRARQCTGSNVLCWRDRASVVASASGSNSSAHCRSCRRTSSLTATRD